MLVMLSSHGSPEQQVEESSQKSHLPVYGMTSLGKRGVAGSELCHCRTEHVRQVLLHRVDQRTVTPCSEPPVQHGVSRH